MQSQQKDTRATPVVIALVYFIVHFEQVFDQWDPNLDETCVWPSDSASSHEQFTKAYFVVKPSKKIGKGVLKCYVHFLW